MNIAVHPRALRLVPSPPGLYFRVGQNDHTTLSMLIAQGHRSFHGVLIDASRASRQQELISSTESARIESILDPMTAASATIGGHSKSHAKLPWGLDRPHHIDDFKGKAGRDRLKKIADFAIKNRFSQVMAPTHLIADLEDPWLAVDRRNTDDFRKILDEAGGKAIGIIYPLPIAYKLLRHESYRSVIIDELHDLPANSLWLQVDGLGHETTAAGVRNYIEASYDFSRLELPIVAHQLGGLPGLALLAANAVGGLCSGLAISQKFSTSHWKKAPDGSPSFAPHARVYFSDFDFMLAPKECRDLFDRNIRLRATFGCRDIECCHRGLEDMLRKPAHHFAVQRMRQVSELGRHPPSSRLRIFIEQYVRPASDRALQFARSGGLDDKMRARSMKHQARLDSIRISLNKLADSRAIRDTLLVPETRTRRAQSLNH